MTIRSIDDETKSRLRARAAEHGHSMEAEVRLILRDALAPDDRGPLGSRIHARFAALGGVDLEIPPRDDISTRSDIDLDP